MKMMIMKNVKDKFFSKKRGVVITTPPTHKTSHIVP